MMPMLKCCDMDRKMLQSKGELKVKDIVNCVVYICTNRNQLGPRGRH